MATKQAVIQWPASGNEVKEGQYGPYTTAGAAVGQKMYAIYGKPGDVLSGLPKGAHIFIQIEQEPDPANGRKKGRAKFVDVCESQPAAPAPQISHNKSDFAPPVTPEQEGAMLSRATASARVMANIYKQLDVSFCDPADVPTVKPTSEDLRAMAISIYIQIAR